MTGPLPATSSGKRLRDCRKAKPDDEGNEPSEAELAKTAASLFIPSVIHTVAVWLANVRNPRRVPACIPARREIGGTLHGQLIAVHSQLRVRFESGAAAKLPNGSKT